VDSGQRALCIAEIRNPVAAVQTQPNDARHHLRQAELCLRVAELMSDPAAAKLLREAATRHFAEVSEFRKWDESRQA
jgi:hypothetical protein